jgi:hypothetical protein
MYDRVTAVTQGDDTAPAVAAPVLHLHDVMLHARRSPLTRPTLPPASDPEMLPSDPLIAPPMRPLDFPIGKLLQQHQAIDDLR